jgi:hypothetical protein
MMRPNDGRIDHLQRRIAHAAAGERLQDHIPDAAVGPAPELSEDRIPVAEFFRQQQSWSNFPDMINPIYNNISN